MLKKTDINFLNHCDRQGISWIYGQGAKFINTQFIPALKRLGKEVNSKREKECVADSFYNLGDVYDFNDAPKLAMKAYKKGISYFPVKSYASGFHREIGYMYWQIGEYKLALKYLRAALKINPNDEHAKMEFEYCQQDLIDNSAPLYKRDDWSLEVCCLLAAFNPRDALIKLHKKRNLKALKLRAQAFALMGDTKSHNKEWDKIINRNETIELDGPDLFYAIGYLDENLEFWNMLLSLRERLALNGVVSFFNELAKNYEELNLRLLWNDFLIFKIAQIERDKKILKKLTKKYKKWEEPFRELKKLDLYL